MSSAADRTEIVGGMAGMSEMHRSVERIAADTGNPLRAVSVDAVVAQSRKMKSDHLVAPAVRQTPDSVAPPRSAEDHQ